MSGSMARYGKYYHAKKVALALQGLVRSRYTEDTLKVDRLLHLCVAADGAELLHVGPEAGEHLR